MAEHYSIRAAAVHHKSRHAADGPDPITPGDIGAAPAAHSHGTVARRNIMSLADPAVWVTDTPRTATNYSDYYLYPDGRVAVTFRLSLQAALAGVSRSNPVTGLVTTLVQAGAPASGYAPHGVAIDGAVALTGVVMNATAGRLDVRFPSASGTWATGAGMTLTGTASWHTLTPPSTLPGTPL